MPSGAKQQLVGMRPKGPAVQREKRHAMRINAPDHAMAGIGDEKPVMHIHCHAIRPGCARRRAEEQIGLAHNGVRAEREAPDLTRPRHRHITMRAGLIQRNAIGARAVGDQPIQPAIWR